MAYEITKRLKQHQEAGLQNPQRPGQALIAQGEMLRRRRKN